jgi:hypothetical protein
MRRILSILTVLIIVSAPVLAQEEKPSIKDKVMKKIEAVTSDEPEAESANTIELSKKMHDIWPMRQKVELALDSISMRLPEGERTKFKGAMRRSIDFDALEQASTDAMADIFTAAELQKMIDFYGSKEGRSVSHKLKDYEAALQPLMVQMMDKALLNAKMGSPKTGAQSAPKN